MFYDGNI